MVGFVLGLRAFSQQGLFVVGGWLVDRYGVRPVVLTGCALRIAVDFRTACLAGAGVFVLIRAGHAWLSPQHIPGRTRTR